MVGFAIAALALVLTAGFATAALRLRSPISFVLGVYVLASVEIVVLAEILSFFDAVGATGFALGQAVLGALAVAAWAATGRPRPPIPSVSGTSLRRHPLLTALVVLVVASTAFQGFLVVSTPPNNGDSMTYHLTRTAAWLERGAVERFPTYDEVQNAYPPNAEIEVLFTFAYADGDTVAAFVQLVAKLVLLVAVYGLARRVRFERPAALFAAVVFGCLTLVVVQSVTTQNHLVVAAQVAAAAYFGLELARGDPRAAILAGLAVGLAVGTKWTGLAALPGLGLLWVVATRDAARLVRLVAWSAVGLVLVGVYGYALNAADTGHLLGDTSGLPIQSRPSPGEFVESLVKLTLDFGDFSGYFRNANEDSSYFGTLGWLLVLPLSAGFTIAWALRRTSAVRGALAVNLPLFMILLAASHPYERFDGRLLILPVALVAPLAAWVYERSPATEVVAAPGRCDTRPRNDLQPGEAGRRERNARLGARPDVGSVSSPSRDGRGDQHGRRGGAGRRPSSGRRSPTRRGATRCTASGSIDAWSTSSPRRARPGGSARAGLRRRRRRGVARGRARLVRADVPVERLASCPPLRVFRAVVDGGPGDSRPASARTLQDRGETQRRTRREREHRRDDDTVTTQGVPMCRHIGATEDAARRRFAAAESASRFPGRSTGARRHRPRTHSRKTASVASVTPSQPQRAATCSRPRAPRRARSVRSPSRRSSAARRAGTSPGGTRRPVSSSTTRSRSPPTELATTGFPCAIASAHARPKPSRREGQATIAALA